MAKKADNKKADPPKATAKATTPPPPKATKAEKKEAKQEYKQEKKEYKQAVKATPKQAPKDPVKAERKAERLNTAKQEYKAAKQNVKSVAPGFRPGKLMPTNPAKVANRIENRQQGRQDNIDAAKRTIAIYNNRATAMGGAMPSNVKDAYAVLARNRQQNMVKTQEQRARQAVKPLVNQAVGRTATTATTAPKPAGTAPAGPAAPVATPTAATTAPTPMYQNKGPQQGRGGSAYQWTKGQKGGGGGNAGVGGDQGVNQMASLVPNQAGMNQTARRGGKLRFA